MKRTKAEWDRIVEQEFRSMPRDWQDEWEELKDTVNSRS